MLKNIKEYSNFWNSDIFPHSNTNENPKETKENRVTKEKIS